MVSEVIKMKDLLINSAMQNIEKNCNYTKEKLAEIKYGLASLYSTITKTIVIFSIAYMLGTLKSLLILMVLYSLLRLTGYGVHAKKSWHCWVSSLLMFLTLPYLCENLIIDYRAKVALGFMSVTLLGFYAPADTEKRPLINKKRRITYKVISASLGLLYTVMFFFIKDNTLSNCILFALLQETLVVLPITYKLFGVKYKNYVNYEPKNMY